MTIIKPESFILDTLHNGDRVRIFGTVNSGRTTFAKTLLTDIRRRRPHVTSRVYVGDAGFSMSAERAAAKWVFEEYDGFAAADNRNADIIIGENILIPTDCMATVLTVEHISDVRGITEDDLLVVLGAPTRNQFEAVFGVPFPGKDAPQMFRGHAYIGRHGAMPALISWQPTTEL